VVILSHLDVVDPGEGTAWESDPWTLRVEGDRLFGRGVEDNNSGIVSSVLALTALRKNGVSLPVAADLVFVSDEENGSEYGLAHLLASRPDIFTPDDLVFVPDAGEADGGLAIIAEKGIAALKFTVTGEQRHAGMPAAAGNSLRAAARLITTLDEVMPRRFPGRNPFFNPPVSTFEPTRMDANVGSTNVIPGRNVFYYDVRALPEYDLREVEDEFRRTAGIVAAAEGVRIELETVNRVAAGPATSPDSPAARALAAAVSVTHGVKLRTIGIGGGTLANFFRQRGIPAIVWSAMLENPHVPNECALASNQIKDAKVWARIIMSAEGYDHAT
jgi:succinyl-diaminopimelate desuccinylase